MWGFTRLQAEYHDWDGGWIRTNRAGLTNDPESEEVNKRSEEGEGKAVDPSEEPTEDDWEPAEEEDHPGRGQHQVVYGLQGRNADGPIIRWVIFYSLFVNYYKYNLLSQIKFNGWTANQRLPPSQHQNCHWEGTYYLSPLPNDEQ